jgi:peptidoglycan-associated lipoprotein
MSTRPYTLAVTLILVGAAPACAKDKPPANPSNGEPPAAIASTPSNGTEANVADGVVLAKEVKDACRIPNSAASPRFEYDSAILLPEGRPVLDTLARCLLEGPLKGRALTLVGRADPRGEQEYNMALGGNRAQSVASYLRTLGVDSKQVHVTSRGELDAVGTTEATWAFDRRVDVTLGPTS